MELWYPKAIRNQAVRDGGSYSPGTPFRGVLHTTESNGFSPRSDSYGGWHTSYPHFTAVERSSGFEIYQHIGIDRAAGALRNPSGGVQTNRASAIQIEIVGKASQSPVMSDRLLMGLGQWMRWVEEQTGIQRTSPRFDDNRAYGVSGSVRMSSAEWDRFNGWCGHQHVPENDHWDPGRIPIERLLQSDTEADIPSVISVPQEGARWRVIDVAAADALNVRAGPGTGNPVVGSLASDELSVTTTGESSGVGTSEWVELSEPLSGWVNGRFLSPVEVRSSLQTEHRVAGVDAPDRLNVRSGPGVDHPIVGSFGPGESDVLPSGAVVVTGMADWYELDSPVSGWVHSRYLESVRGQRRSFDPDLVVVPDSDQYTHGAMGDNDF